MTPLERCRLGGRGGGLHTLAVNSVTRNTRGRRERDNLAGKGWRERDNRKWLAEERRRERLGGKRLAV
jgi:hypothetical protein